MRTILVKHMVDSPPRANMCQRLNPSHCSWSSGHEYGYKELRPHKSPESEITGRLQKSLDYLLLKCYL